MLDWDDGDERHIREHGVEPDECEEALLDPRRLAVAAHRVEGEQRGVALGATESGRILFVVFTRRGGAVRVVTARDADVRQKRRYRTGGR